MGAWQACFIVLLVDLSFGRDIPVNNNYVIKQIESCPDVGYYFRRDLAPNAVDPGPCYLCFCQNNGTAVCWERERRRCDVEKYHHHRVGRQSRFRRSPAGLSDIFFRDASRDFFNMNSPEECKPFEASYSDGCPPVDWCIGCTVCDCDANGRWDCHILSFCDGKEKKKKIKPGRKSKPRNVGRRNAIKKGAIKSNIKTTTAQPKKNDKIKPAPIKVQNKKQTKLNNTKKATKKVIVRNQQKKTFRKQITTKRPQSSMPNQNKSKINGLHKNSKGKVIKKNDTKTIGAKAKIIKNSPRKSIALQRTQIDKVINPGNNNDTVKLGQKIVKQVMSQVQQLLMNEMKKINSSRIERSAMLNCNRIKDKQIDSMNARSKFMAKNKEKFNILPNFMDKYNDEKRRKREVSNEKEILNNTTPETTYMQDTKTVVPLQNKNNTSTEHMLFDVTLVPSSAPVYENYFKYLMQNDVNETSSSIITESVTKATEDIDSEMKNLVIPLETMNNISSYSVENLINNKTISNNDPEVNDLKFTKWFIVKVDKDEEVKTAKKRLLLTKPKLENLKNQSYNHTTLQNNVVSNIAVTNRKNITDIVIKRFDPPKNYLKQLSILNSTHVSGLQNVLQNLIKDIKSSNKTNKVKKNPKTSIMKYVRKFFHKVFSRKKIRNEKLYGLGPKEDHTLQILCDNFGSCNISRKNRFILKYKLQQLNQETKTILQSIKIIKGLLRLLNLPYKNNNLNTLKQTSSFESDLQKLSIILRDSFNIEGISEPLTDTQINQINYIKKNTQIFIESVKKFADILNEIIMITNANIDNKKPKSAPKQKANDPILFRKIKKMLKKYNILQNTFMKKIYETINSFEKKYTSTKSCTTTTEKYMGKSKETYNDKVIESYSRNIIINLNRLKNLAQALSPKRTKRDIFVRDNALEYLLTLMEYMIQQNQNLGTAPANDGIDFLIDAIKNAPDVKPIRKKVLDYAKTMQLNDTDISDILEDSDSNRISKEVDQKLQEDVLKDESNQVEQTTADVDNVTQKVYYKAFSNDQTPEEIEITTDYDVTKKRSNDEKVNVGFDKFESNIAGSKKLENYTDEAEDESAGDIETDTLNKTVVITQAVEPTTQNINIEEVSTKKEKTETNESRESDSDSQDTNGINKARMDWVDVIYNKEFKEHKEMNASYYFSTNTVTMPIPLKTTEKNIENISGISNEINKLESMKKVTKSNEDDVLSKKHESFLKSLDYGTEKPDFEEIESRNEDKSDDDTLTYFV